MKRVIFFIGFFVLGVITDALADESGVQVFTPEDEEAAKELSLSATRVFPVTTSKLPPLSARDRYLKDKLGEKKFKDLTKKDQMEHDLLYLKLKRKENQP